MDIKAHPPETIKTVTSSPPTFHQAGWREKLGKWVDRTTANIFIMPAVLVVLLLSIFPLLVSLYLSLSRLKLVKGGIEFRFVGFANYQKLLFGDEQTHFLGVAGRPTLFGWLFFSIVIVWLGYSLARTVTSPQFRPRKLIGSLFSYI
jgi:multiple sugar transport system permease protein